MTKKKRAGRPPRPRALGLALERRRAGLTQGEAAERFGASKATWVRWEHGVAAPELGVLERIAAAWDTTVERLRAKPTAREVREVQRQRALALALERLSEEHGSDAVRVASVDL